MTDKRDIVERYQKGAGIVELARAVTGRIYQRSMQIIKDSWTPSRKLLHREHAHRAPAARRADGGRHRLHDPEAPCRPVCGGHPHPPGAGRHRGRRRRCITAAPRPRQGTRCGMQRTRPPATGCSGSPAARSTPMQRSASARLWIDACGLVPDEEPVYDIRKTSERARPRARCKELELTCELLRRDVHRTLAAQVLHSRARQPASQ